MDRVAEILRQKGPRTARELIKELIGRNYAKNEPAARQQISRANIISTKPVKFGNGYIYYLEKHKKAELPQKIVKHLSERPPLNRAYLTLRLNKGYITKGQISKASCAIPAGTNSHRSTTDDIVSQLLLLGILEQFDNRADFYRITPQFGRTNRHLLHSFLHLLSFEQKLLESFALWVQNVYIVGNNSYDLRASETDAITFNGFFWDFKAPCFIGPFAAPRRSHHSSRAFLVADMNAVRQYTQTDFESFLERVASIKARWKSIHILPIIVAKSYHRDLLTQIRTQGIAPLTVKEVGGYNAMELLRAFSKVVTRGLSGDTSELDKVLSLANESGNEGLVANIKGTLFEIMIGFAYKSEGYDVIFNKIVTDEQGVSWDIDVFARKGKTCFLIECKSTSNVTTEDHLEQIERHNRRTEIALLPYGWNIGSEFDEINSVYLTLSAEKYIPEAHRKSYVKNCIMFSVRAQADVRQFLSKADKKLLDIVDKYYSPKS